MFGAMDGGDKRTGMYSQRFSEGLPPCRHGKLITLKIRLKPVTNSQVKGFRREHQEEECQSNSRLIFDLVMSGSVISLNI